MNALESIKQGIEDQDWNLVVEGYSMMTGENLSQKPQKRTRARKKVSVKTNVFGNSPKFFDDTRLASADRITKHPKLGVNTSTISQKRAKYQKVSVVCSQCNRKSKVSPKLVPPKIGGSKPRYVCNDCCGTGK